MIEKNHIEISQDKATQRKEGQKKTQNSDFFSSTLLDIPQKH